MGVSITGDWTGWGGYVEVGIFYIAVVQVVLLYGLESWVMSPQIGKVLGSIHHQDIWQITGKIPNMNGY